MPTPSSSSRFAPYRQALQAISTRTGAPLPALVFSFAVLHEITAIAPIFAIFLGARQLGLGERVVSAATAAASNGEDNVIKQKSRQWINDGEQWAERVGRHYGIFGFEKGKRGDTAHNNDASAAELSSALSPKLAGDVANVVVAYGLTKALLPVRIGLSLYLTPWFSRRVVEPVRIGVVRVFSRNG
ncbi:hypothetical protein BDW22DRAFT_1175058 [Trametopsis cervina]|nr:hypothetical protein BDW22DRAFT_1175058 [Trametopsis cervina]